MGKLKRPETAGKLERCQAVIYTEPEKRVMSRLGFMTFKLLVMSIDSHVGLEVTILTWSSSFNKSNSFACLSLGLRKSKQLHIGAQALDLRFAFGEIEVLNENLELIKRQIGPEETCLAFADYALPSKEVDKNDEYLEADPSVIDSGTWVAPEHIYIAFQTYTHTHQMLCKPDLETPTVKAMLNTYHTSKLCSNQCGSSLLQTIDAPVPLVWSLIRRFENPQGYKLFVKKCTMLAGDGGIGSVREIMVTSGLPAGVSVERLDNLDDDKHVLKFSIIGGDHRLANYSSTITLHEEGEKYGGKTVAIESYVVDVPTGSSSEDTCAFANTIIACNLRSLAKITEEMVCKGFHSTSVSYYNRSSAEIQNLKETQNNVQTTTLYMASRKY
ncbi:hypothetical protein VNO80_28792 [Phaseolus coccineus]|uniref:Uncharacterized protein n=1 Tax=Phaseolus coccineus TaxID=3886 RepID=A0AAN9QBT6_PHACN